MLPNWLSSLWGVQPGKSLVVTAKPRAGLPGAQEAAPVKLPQEEFLRCSQPKQLSGWSRAGSEGGSRGCCRKASERQAGWTPMASHPAFCSHGPQHIPGPACPVLPPPPATLSCGLSSPGLPRADRQPLGSPRPLEREEATWRGRHPR